MKGIYKFYMDCWRAGDLEGLFIANTEDVKKLIGQYIYFGEVLGKHSEVDCNIEEDHLELISVDPEHVEMFEQLDLSVGYNPFDYWEESEEEEEE